MRFKQNFPFVLHLISLMSLTCSLYNNAFYRKKAKLKSSASEVQKNVLGFLLAGLKAIASMCDIIQKWSNPAQK